MRSKFEDSSRYWRRSYGAGSVVECAPRVMISVSVSNPAPLGLGRLAGWIILVFLLQFGCSLLRCCVYTVRGVARFAEVCWSVCVPGLWYKLIAQHAAPSTVSIIAKSRGLGARAKLEQRRSISENAHTCSVP